MHFNPTPIIFQPLEIFTNTSETFVLILFEEISVFSLLPVWFILTPIIGQDHFLQRRKKITHFNTVSLDACQQQTPVRTGCSLMCVYTIYV